MELFTRRALFHLWCVYDSPTFQNGCAHGQFDWKWSSSFTLSERIDVAEYAEYCRRRHSKWTSEWLLCSDNGFSGMIEPWIGLGIRVETRVRSAKWAELSFDSWSMLSRMTGATVEIVLYSSLRNYYNFYNTYACMALASSINKFHDNSWL